MALVDPDTAVANSLARWGEYKPKSLAAYHSEKACNKNFYRFVEASSAMFRDSKKEHLLALLKKCLEMRRADHEKHINDLPRSPADAELDRLHADVIAIFERITSQLESLKKDAMPRYRFVLGDGNIFLYPGIIADGDIQPPLDEGWTQAGKRRRTRRKNGRRRTQKKMKTYV
jgi:hypothetical protein